MEKHWHSNNAVYKVDGVSEIFNTLKDQDWKTFCNRMDSSLDDYDYNNESREAFIKMFLGENEFNSSKKFLDELKAIL